jgi:hypothetical protein
MHKFLLEINLNIFKLKIDDAIELILPYNKSESKGDILNSLVKGSSTPANMAKFDKILYRVGPLRDTNM